MESNLYCTNIRERVSKDCIELGFFFGSKKIFFQRRLRSNDKIPLTEMDRGSMTQYSFCSKHEDDKHGRVQRDEVKPGYDFLR